jgi:hypothetical protein
MHIRSLCFCVSVLFGLFGPGVSRAGDYSLVTRNSPR